MVSIRAAFLCCFLAESILLGTSVFAAPLSANEQLRYENGFSAVQQTTRSFRSDLRQTLTLQGLTEPLVSEGELFYQAPHRLLIRFTRPQGEWMLVDDKTFLLQKQGHPLVTRDLGAEGTHAATMLDFFSSDPARWHRDFEVSMNLNSKGDRLEVHLRPWHAPTSVRQGVDHIVTTLHLPDYQIESIEVSIHGANQLRFDFLNGVRNVPIDPTLFHVPKVPTPSISIRSAPTPTTP